MSVPLPSPLQPLRPLGALGGFARTATRLVVGLAVTAAGLVAVAWWLWIRMPGDSHRGPLPPLTGEESALAGALRADIVTLADDIGPRHARRPDALEAAAMFIEKSLAAAGHEVRRLPYAARGGTFRNLEVELRGTRLPEEVVVIGAHYDTVPGSPGANDNGTGVAALLALARAFPPGTALARTLRLVAFVNEEAPFAHTPDMGSFVYARACRERGDQIVAMLSLETMGCFSDEEGSQRYPTSLRRLYPRTGSFIAFVGDAASKPLVQRVVGSFRSHARFPSEGAALPRIVRDAGRSDHWSFWQHGYRALMVTDTANFRYRHYHTAEDLPAEVDHARLARVVSGLGAVVRDLLAE